MNDIIAALVFAILIGLGAILFVAFAIALLDVWIDLSLLFDDDDVG